LQRLAGDLDAVELKAWDDMARVLAHEMLNSLTPIASLSESLDALLRQGDRNADVAAALETIRRRSRGLMSFVERYRTVVDVPEPQRQKLPLRALLADMERLIRPTLAERGIQLTTRIEPPELTVLGDRDLLEQALINILRNATEALSGHSEAGGAYRDQPARCRKACATSMWPTMAQAWYRRRASSCLSHSSQPSRTAQGSD